MLSCLFLGGGPVKIHTHTFAPGSEDLVCVCAGVMAISFWAKERLALIEKWNPASRTSANLRCSL